MIRISVLVNDPWGGGRDTIEERGGSRIEWVIRNKQQQQNNTR